MVKDAYGQAMSHLLLFRYLTGGKAAAALDTAAKDLQAAGDDKAKLASAAKAAADAATSMMTPVGALVPAEGNTAALLGKIVGEADSATIGGFRGAQQQALALSTLCASYKSGKGAAGLDDVQKMIDENLLALVGDEAAFKAADYATALKAVAAKLTPMLPAGAAMPDAIDLK
jgi:hypothetical protein